MKYSIFIIVFCLTGCEYHQDRLLIQNGTKKEICSELLIQNKVDGKYQEVAANLEIQPYKSGHPISRSSISFELQNNSVDSILYIVVHNYSDREYVFKNIDNLVFDKRFKTKRFSKSKLDSLNWTVKYDEQ